jgi:uncharacterized protein
MHSDLESLINLQHIDARISEYAREQEGFPAALSELESINKKAQDAVETIKRKMDALSNEKKSLESSIAEAKARLDKSQDLLNTIKTNREYDAAHTQIENFKTMIITGDVKIKKIDQDSAELQQSLETKQTEMEKTVSDNAAKIAELKSKIDTINGSIAEVTSKRDDVVKTVSKTLLRTYNHILKHRKSGQVLSFVNSSDRTCSVCFKILEAQLVNEIRKSDKIIICQNCGSIFVWKNDDTTDKA